MLMDLLVQRRVVVFFRDKGDLWLGLMSQVTRKPRHVIFVDVGHEDMSVAVVAFSKGQLNVKSTAYDRNLGGRDIDYALLEHFSIPIVATNSSLDKSIIKSYRFLRYRPHLNFLLTGPVRVSVFLYVVCPHLIVIINFQSPKLRLHLTGYARKGLVRKARVKQVRIDLCMPRSATAH